MHQICTPCLEGHGPWLQLGTPRYKSACTVFVRKDYCAPSSRPWSHHQSTAGIHTHQESAVTLWMGLLLLSCFLSVIISKNTITYIPAVNVIHNFSCMASTMCNI
jgi:hypothetical protein